MQQPFYSDDRPWLMEAADLTVDTGATSGQRLITHHLLGGCTVGGALAAYDPADDVLGLTADDGGFRRVLAHGVSAGPLNAKYIDGYARSIGDWSDSSRPVAAAALITFAVRKISNKSVSKEYFFRYSKSYFMRASISSTFEA